MEQFIQQNYNTIINEFGGQRELNDTQREMLGKALLWEKLEADYYTDLCAEEYTDD